MQDRENIGPYGPQKYYLEWMHQQLDTVERKDEKRREIEASEESRNIRAQEYLYRKALQRVSGQFDWIANFGWWTVAILFGLLGVIVLAALL